MKMIVKSKLVKTIIGTGHTLVCKYMLSTYILLILIILFLLSRNLQLYMSVEIIYFSKPNFYVFANIDARPTL